MRAASQVAACAAATKTKPLILRQGLTHVIVSAGVIQVNMDAQSNISIISQARRPPALSPRGNLSCSCAVSSKKGVRTGRDDGRVPGERRGAAAVGPSLLSAPRRASRAEGPAAARLFHPLFQGPLPAENGALLEGPLSPGGRRSAPFQATGRAGCTPTERARVR